MSMNERAMLSAASHQRLTAMGIEVWVPQGSRDSEAEPRVRLASGDGDWVLVQRQAWGREHPALIADITATIGPERCRFGQWASGEDAGVGVSELSERGIQHVLAFGMTPLGPRTDERVLVAAELSELALSAAARRELWLALKARLR